MLPVIASVLGGVGLFLLGMILMTDGLKSLAGDALRRLLGRFTTNRFSAFASGAAITTLVQSSSATTIATIGFVSAGLLPFSNAIGVIIGAAVGTTATGWIVALLGLKLSVGKIMLPLIGVGAFMKLVGRGRWSQLGTALAGFGVIFVGIDTLQTGMAGLAESFQPESWPAPTWGGRALLVLIGMGMTIVMQSSSAAVATTLAAVSGGTINIEQAAALVVGQNIGTATSSLIASIGASTPARRTAIAHIIFNASSGTAGFILLPWLVSLLDGWASALSHGEHALTIAAFHTVFNLMGAAMFLPWTGKFASFVERHIRLKGPRLTQHLDASLLEVPAVALEAARRVLKDIGATLFESLARTLKGRGVSSGLDEIEAALVETRRFLARIPPPATQGFEFQRQVSTVHALDHLQRLAADMREPGAAQTAQGDEALRRVADELAVLANDLALQVRAAELEPDSERAKAFSTRLADERRTARPAILEATAARRINAEEALAELGAQRWLDRLAYHVWRASHHLREMTRKEMAVHAEAEAAHAPDAGRPPETPPTPSV